MKVAVAADHAGRALKDEILRFLAGRHEFVDLGTHDDTSVDYPDYAARVCSQVLETKGVFGILVCGSGTGMSMAANKHTGIRAALCRSEFEARMARAHNDANVLCLGQRVTGVGLALAAVDAFLVTAFEGGRHAARLQKMESLERSAAGAAGV